MDWVAVGLTIKLAALTTLALAVIGLPLAYWLATTKRAWRPVVDAAVAVPLLLPPTVLGFYFLMATGPDTLPGRLYAGLFDGTIPFSFAGVLMASVLYNLPFAVRPFTSGFAAVDRRLIEAARCLGASAPRTFAEVVLPLSWPAVLTGLVLAFAHTVGEFGVVGDEQGGPGLGQRHDPLDHDLAVDGIEPGGGFVENEDPGILESRSGETDPLALSGRDRRAPFAEYGVVSVGELDDEVVSVDQTGRVLDRLGRRGRVAGKEVLANRDSK